MKKLFLLAAILTLALCFASCGEEQQETQDTSVQTQETQDTGTQAEENTPNATEYAIYEELEMFALKPTIEPTVLVDEQGVKITANSITYDAYSAEIALTIENNTDKNLSFVSGSLGYSVNSVNGFMIYGGYLNVDIAPAKKANESITIKADELAMLGITDIADIALGFDISDDDYDEYLKTGALQIKTSIADSYDYGALKFGNAINNGYLAETYGYNLDMYEEAEIYNKSGVKINSYAIVTNSSGEQSLFVEYENTSDSEVAVAVSDFSLNALAVTSGTWSSETINASKRMVAAYSFDAMIEQEFRELLGLNNIGNVMFGIELRDAEYNMVAEKEHIGISINKVEAGFDIAGEEVYNAEGIRVVSKGIMKDPVEYSDDINILLLVENNSPQPVQIDVAYGSLSINGFMTNDFSSGRRIDTNKAGVIVVNLMASSLEENNIANVDDIENVEMTLEIKNDDYNTIAEPVITISNTGETFEPQMKYVEVDTTASTNANAQDNEPEQADNEQPDQNAVSESTQTQADTSTTNSEWQQFLIDYEAWVDSYIEFMEKYNEDPTDLALLADYAALTLEMAQWAEDAEDIEGELTGDDLVAYTETVTRITLKLSEAMV